jgi:2-polyprenyl-3-methyl-5-hydroxy-6-metoxy-1,4-benzoquinol methylase
LKIADRSLIFSLRNVVMENPADEKRFGFITDCIPRTTTVDPREARILDLGCGQGALGIRFGRLGSKRVTGIDLDPASIDCAMESCRITDILPRRLASGWCFSFRRAS